MRIAPDRRLSIDMWSSLFLADQPAFSGLNLLGALVGRRACRRLHLLAALQFDVAVMVDQAADVGSVLHRHELVAGEHLAFVVGPPTGTGPNVDHGHVGPPLLLRGRNTHGY